MYNGAQIIINDIIEANLLDDMNVKYFEINMQINIAKTADPSAINKKCIVAKKSFNNFPLYNN